MKTEFLTVSDDTEIRITVKGDDTEVINEITGGMVDEITILKIVYRKIHQKELTNHRGDYDAGRTYLIQIYVSNETWGNVETYELESELPWITDSNGRKIGFGYVGGKLTNKVHELFGKPQKKWESILNEFLVVIDENQKTERTSLMMKELNSMIGIEGIAKELKLLKIREVIDG